MLREILHVILLFGGWTASAQEFRRPRQLDLGPDTNKLTNDNSNPAPARSNFQQGGYLPPIEPAGAQNDPVVVPTTTPSNRPTHHGRDLCTDPFHSFLCSPLRPRRPITGASNQIVGANTFLEPSKVLAPPLNDLEEITTVRALPTTQSTRYYTQTPTTTVKPTTRSRPTTTTTTTTTERVIGPEATNDVRSYLPPEPIAPAAAQQDLAVVKPDEDHDHNHDHPHHHGRDLCSDPFHSFLCAPLKARKRITGALPNALQGQNTFVSPTKVRPDPEISPQPSNEVDLKYLPPTTTSRIIPQPSNEDLRAYLPPSTTQRPTTIIRFRPEPSNEVSRAFIPPSTTRRPFTTTTTTTTTTTRAPPTTTIRFQPEPSNEVDRAYLPPSTTRRPIPTTRAPTSIQPAPSNEVELAYLPPVTTTTQRPLEVQPSNEVDRAYLPPIVPQPSNTDPLVVPAAASNDLSVAEPDHDHNHEHGSHGFKDICSDPFHSFLCTVPKPRKRITGDVPDRLRHLISPAPSNVDETRVRIPVIKKVVPQNEIISPAQSQNIGVAIANSNNNIPNYNYPKPEKPLTLPAESKPVVSYDYTTKATTTIGYAYPKPQVELRLPSKVNEITIPTTTRQPSTTRRPTTTVGYVYNPPENKLTLPSETKQVVGYDYPKPKVEFPLPTKGYSYPKPERKFPLPTEVKPTSQPFIPQRTTSSLLQDKSSSFSNNILPPTLKEANQRIKANRISSSSNSDFIPVNQVEYPSDGELGVRFGQRLKRRQRLSVPLNSHRL